VAQAQASIISLDQPPRTETYTAPLEGCLSQDLVGTVTSTETSTGQAVDTGNGVITAHGVNTFDYHLALPDGMYVQSGLNRERFAFVANMPHSSFTNVSQDVRTIYAADGTPVGTLAIHEVIHTTYTDLNGNFLPDPGEFSVTFDHFRLSCR
jgi:hypothetical protein